MRRSSTSCVDMRITFWTLFLASRNNCSLPVVSDVPVLVMIRTSCWAHTLDALRTMCVYVIAVNPQPHCRRPAYDFVMRLRVRPPKRKLHRQLHWQCRLELAYTDRTNIVPDNDIIMIVPTRRCSVLCTVQFRK